MECEWNLTRASIHGFLRGGAMVGGVAAIGVPRPRAVALVVMAKEHQVAPIVFAQVNTSKEAANADS